LRALAGTRSAQPVRTAAESSPLARRAWIALIAVGLLATGAGLAIEGKAWLGQQLLERGWQRMQDDPQAADGAGRPWAWADTHPVARLLAPAQGADVLILAGATGRTLAWGPGHLDGTALPGEPGEAVVTAHRDTHFAFLARVRRGDALVIERRDGVRVSYRVVDTAVVAADQLALRAQDDTHVPTLTLVTCYPFGALAPGTPWRYVVTAVVTTRPIT
jgi:sortase A